MENPNISKDEIAELKNIVKYQQTIIKNYQQKLKQKTLDTFLAANLSSFGSFYYQLYSYITKVKTPLTILRGHIQMLRKKVVNMDPTNAFLLSEEFNLFEKNIATIYDILSSVDSFHSQIPHDPQEIQLSLYLNTFQNKIATIIDKYDINFSISCPDHISLVINPLMLDLMFINIIQAIINVANYSNNKEKHFTLSVFHTDTSIIITCNDNLSTYNDDHFNKKSATVTTAQNREEYNVSILNWIVEELGGKIEIKYHSHEILIIIELPENVK